MTTTKNILFISYDGMTDPLGQSQVIPYLAGLTKWGYRFTILSCEKPAKFSHSKEYVEKILKDYPVTWVPILYHKNPPVFSTVYDVAMLQRKAGQLHARDPFDMVHTRAGIPALIGLWMKKKLGVKFLHDMREFYADSRIDGGMWSRKNIFYNAIYRYFKMKEAHQVASADGIVCLTYAAEKIIRTWPQYRKETPLKVIPCSVDMDLFDPEKIDRQQKDLVARELQLEAGDFVVSYLGSIGGWYLTDEMMQFCRSVMDRIGETKFLFISPHERGIIIDAAAKAGIPADKVIVRNARRHEVPLLLSLSRYSVFFIKPCYSKQSSSPTKHGEIMAMGLPVITNYGVGDVAAIVEEFDSGIVLKKLDKNNYDNAAAQLLWSTFDAQRIRSGARAFYSLDHALQKYREVYRSILA